ncbi:MAG: hypothetical protein II685_01365 [Clostridia bacterium]|nr:hypothetical protein [Clostridia bacterium]
MEGLNIWVAELCVCSAAVAAAEKLLPEGGVKKSMYFILGLLVLTCFASPLESFEVPDFETAPENYVFEENTDWLNRTTEEVFKSNVSSLVEQRLTKMNVKSKNIEIYTDIDDDNRIFIDKVRITVDSADSDKLDAITDDIYKSLGLDADVVVR